MGPDTAVGRIQHPEKMFRDVPAQQGDVALAADLREVIKRPISALKVKNRMNSSVTPWMEADSGTRSRQRTPRLRLLSVITAKTLGAAKRPMASASARVIRRSSRVRSRLPCS